MLTKPALVLHLKHDVNNISLENLENGIIPIPECSVLHFQFLADNATVDDKVMFHLSIKYSDILYFTSEIPLACLLHSPYSSLDKISESKVIENKEVIINSPLYTLPKSLHNALSSQVERNIMSCSISITKKMNGFSLEDDVFYNCNFCLQLQPNSTPLPSVPPVLINKAGPLVIQDSEESERKISLEVKEKPSAFPNSNEVLVDGKPGLFQRGREWIRSTQLGQKILDYFYNLHLKETFEQGETWILGYQLLLTCTWDKKAFMSIVEESKPTPKATLLEESNATMSHHNIFLSQLCHQRSVSSYLGYFARHETWSLTVKDTHVQTKILKELVSLIETFNWKCNFETPQAIYFSKHDAMPSYLEVTHINQGASDKCETKISLLHFCIRMEVCEIGAPNMTAKVMKELLKPLSQWMTSNDQSEIIQLVSVEEFLLPSKPTSEDASKGAQLNEDVISIITIFLKIYSKLWLTYRRQFPIIVPTSYTSDAGWGCMIRTGQSLLANAFVCTLLGRDWRVDFPCSKIEMEIYLKVLSWFQDDLEEESYYSMHRIVNKGIEFGKKVGEWYSPFEIAQVLGKLTALHSRCPLAIASTSDNCISKSAIMELAASGGPNDSSYYNKWKPILLLVASRLGVSNINDEGLSQIKELFKHSSFLGISGGRPDKSLYFIGYQGNELLYLDPHFTRDYQEFSKSTLFPIESVHCSDIFATNIKDMDPSMLFGFLFRSKSEFDIFCQEMDGGLFSFVESKEVPNVDISLDSLADEQ